jgi:hypothetical protein
MRVLIKEPEKAARFEEIDNELAALQAAVGGYIETVTPFTDLTIICDEEGRLKGKPYNCRICGVSFVGTVVLAGVDKDEFTDVPMRDEKDVRLLFPQLYEEVSA